MRRKRILLYSHDTYGLGHLRRNLLLSHRFCQLPEEPGVLVATGSPRTQAFDIPDHCDTFKLPAVSKQPDGTYRARTLPITIEEVTRIRADLIVSAYESFRPHLVLVDHAPTGMGGELVPLFRKLASESPEDRAKLVLGLRDIIDEPDRVRTEWEKADAWRWIDDLYDRILVYGDPNLRTTAEDLGLAERLPGKVRHVGYLGRPSLEEAGLSSPYSEDEPSTPMILVTVGGGGDGQRVLRAFAKYLESVPRPAPFRTVMVTGPFLSPARFREIQERVAATGHPVEVYRFTNRLTDYLTSACGVISMAGYNSVTEILAARVPCLLVPREAPRREQSLRVERLHRIVPVQSCPMDSLDRATIDAFVSNCLESPERSPAPRVRLDGLTRAAAEVRSLLLDESSRSRPPRGSRNGGETSAISPSAKKVQPRSSSKDGRLSAFASLTEAVERMLGLPRRLFHGASRG